MCHALCVCACVRLRVWLLGRGLLTIQDALFGFQGAPRLPLGGWLAWGLVTRLPCGVCLRNAAGGVPVHADTFHRLRVIAFGGSELFPVVGCAFFGCSVHLCDCAASRATAHACGLGG